MQHQLPTTCIYFKQKNS